MTPIRLLLVLLLAASPAAGAVRRRAVVLLPPQPDLVTAAVIAPPRAVTVEGEAHLAWEVAITNNRTEDITISRIDVLAPSGTLASYTTLSDRMLNIPIREQASEVMHAGEIAIIYFLVSRDQVPPSITHVIQLTSSRGVETYYGPLTEVRQELPLVISAPLRGSSWLAANGFHNDTAHRRAVLLLEDGRLLIPQRYAIDWVQLDEAGSTYTGDVRRNTSFYAYGEELLAASDGIVTAIQDGLPENVPRQTPVIPITIDTAPGNFVLIDAGAGRYILYAHLQPGSLRVKTGDHVTRGDVLGLLGNSGNSTEPHLHFHICDANAALVCDGLPWVFDHFSTETGPKAFELPMNLSLVDFEN
jgi:hypothetical protein